MKSLHVAALPFPTPQGTQALLGEYLRSLARSGHHPHLLCYAHGANEGPSDLPIHRVRGGPIDKSERSGPSWRKLLADAALVRSIGPLVRQIRPDVVIAHHVEAAAACLLADVAPLAFVAHTRLDAELPVYLPARGPFATAHAARFAGKLGGTIDRTLVRLTRTIGTVSPDLARHVAYDIGGVDDVIELVAPWPLPPPVTDAERRAARDDLRLAAETYVLSFVGNLDRYQGWEYVLESLALLRGNAAHATLIVASASAPEPLSAHANRLGLAERVRVIPLRGEDTRRTVHAASDLVVVPRRVPGGLPVKLLDALSRGVCVVAQRRALAGLETVRDAILLADDDDPRALANTITLALVDGSARARLGAMGRELVRTMHSDRAFLATFETLVDAAVRNRRK